MADPFSGKSPFGGTNGSSKSSHGSGVGHFVGNLLKDVEDTAKGTPAGLISLVKHPVGTAEAAAKSTWADWSPLFHGNTHQWWTNFVNHPLAPILDVSAFVTGGAGAAGRVARALDEAGVAAEGGKVAKLADYTRPSTLKLSGADAKGAKLPDMQKRLSTNPLTKYRQTQMSKMADQMGAHLPAVFSKQARYDRAEMRTVQGRRAALHGWMGMVTEAGKKLTGPDRKMYEEQSLANTVNQLHDFAFKHDASMPIPDGYEPVRRLTGAQGRLTRLARSQNKTFEEDLKSIGERATISNVPKNGKLTKTQMESAVKVDGGKNLLLVPNYSAKRLGLEGANASSTVKLLYKHPTSVWRMIQLGYRPAFFVNNFVGNYFMYAMAHDGVNGFRGYVDALRQTHAGREYKVANSLEKALAKQKGGWQEQHFRDQLGNTLSDSVMQELGGVAKVQHKFSRWSLFPVTHNLADRFLRKASINALMREEPAVRKMMKSENVSFDQAASKVLNEDRKNGGEIRQRVAQRVMDTMGDYHTLSPGERRLRSVVPFYTWDRHITRHITQVLGEHPARVDALSKLGQQGTVQSEKILGDIPAFLKGSIPLSLLGLHVDHPSRIATLQANGLNPYSTLPDLANSLTRLVSSKGGSAGETVGSQINPFLESAIEQISGSNPLSGTPAKKEPGGVLGGTFLGTMGNLSQANVLKSLLGGTPQPKNPNHPFLYEKNPMQYLSALLGIPIKQVNPAAAAKLAKQERKRH